MAKRFEHLGKIYPGKVDANRRLLAIDVTFPRIICLCGSTKFVKEFHDANLALTLAGYIVLTVGSFVHSDAELKVTEEQKIELDLLHKHKIELADAVLVINVDGYVGQSTKSEIDYSHKIGKPLAYLCGLTGKVPENIAQVVDKIFKEA